MSRSSIDNRLWSFSPGVHRTESQALRLIHRQYLRPFSGRGSFSTGEGLGERNKTYFIYLASVALGVLGLSYAAVPLYQVFCQQTGYGGTTQTQTNEEVLSKLRPVTDARPISIYFQTYTGSAMPWEFVPEQKEVVVVPGETALAFFEAHNPTDEAIIGVATYNVLPARAGIYFHKIQCFCFDEQRLKAHERVDMPVFFYVDPKILTDPQMKNVKSITLSYTFFQSASDDDDVSAALEAANTSTNTAVAV